MSGAGGKRGQGQFLFRELRIVGGIAAPLTLFREKGGTQEKWHAEHTQPKIPRGP